MYLWGPNPLKEEPTMAAADSEPLPNSNRTPIIYTETQLHSKLVTVPKT